MTLENSVYEFCRDYSRTPSRGERLIIYGENGTGKSLAAKAINRWANRAAIELPVVLGIGEDAEYRLPICKFYNWPSLMTEMKSGEWGIVEEILPAELLILDDVGAEHDPSHIAVERLYVVLEARVNRWTIITTNYGPAHWENRFERRISSRLMRNSRHVALDQVPDWNSR